MKRRSFLYSGALAGISYSVLPFFSCNPAVENSKALNQTAVDFALDENTISGLQEKLNAGTFTSKSITQLYLDRIAAVDKAGPSLNAVVEINPDALKIAGEMDEERKNKKIRGPLHGIPVLIKENIDTADQMQTTAGALALAGNKASKDAHLVKLLRDAGAVLLGKTNLSEWANFRSSRSSSGWSGRGGQTKNPYVLDRSPCGSSSGSGVAVAANLCVVAVGTETDGSISCPASINGIVGIKPTVGLVSRSGIIPISATQDTAGPLARTVADAAAFLSVLAGTDEADKATSGSIGKIQKDYTVFLDKDALKGKRIGMDPKVLKQHEGVDELFQNALNDIKNAGAEIVEVSFLDKNRELGDAEFQVLLYEFKDGVNKYLATANAPVKTLEEVIAFNKANDSVSMPFFKQELLEKCQAKGDLNSKEYIDAVAKTTSGRKFIDELMDKNKLNAIVTPANGASWCIDVVNGDAFTGYGGYSLAAKTGYPSVTVPMGLLQGLPTGVVFFGRAFDEGGLISIAYAYEQKSNKRVKPAFQPTVKS
jgi:amidase